ncbi:hypothetical protein AAVH_09539 [Aphelenchoides avenae]|nr:hypothetical protein AAVH_09539 [Aphelenchus avenae]
MTDVLTSSWIPSVQQIIVGYVRYEEKDIEIVNGREHYPACGSVTLVKIKDKHLLVDCGSPWHKDELVKTLDDVGGISPQQIDVLIITHPHSDHCGNVNLFPNAWVVTSATVWTDESLERHNVEELKDVVRIHSLPGHTRSDISIEVRQRHGNQVERTVVISGRWRDEGLETLGDLFENADDHKSDDLWKPMSALPFAQEVSRLRVRQLADVIVPGHGPAFFNQRKPDPMKFSHAGNADVSHPLIRIIAADTGEEVRHLECALVKSDEAVVVVDPRAVEAPDGQSSVADVRPEAVTYVVLTKTSDPLLYAHLNAFPNATVIMSTDVGLPGSKYAKLEEVTELSKDVRVCRAVYDESDDASELDVIVNTSVGVVKVDPMTRP